MTILLAWFGGLLAAIWYLRRAERRERQRHTTILLFDLTEFDNWTETPEKWEPAPKELTHHIPEDDPAKVAERLARGDW